MCDTMSVSLDLVAGFVRVGSPGGRWLSQGAPEGARDELSSFKPPQPRREHDQRTAQGPGLPGQSLPDAQQPTNSQEESRGHNGSRLPSQLSRSSTLVCRRCRLTTSRRGSFDWRIVDPCLLGPAGHGPLQAPASAIWLPLPGPRIGPCQSAVVSVGQIATIESAPGSSPGQRDPRFAPSSSGNAPGPRSWRSRRSSAPGRRRTGNSSSTASTSPTPWPRSVENRLRPTMSPPSGSSSTCSATSRLAVCLASTTSWAR